MRKKPPKTKHPIAKYREENGLTRRAFAEKVGSREFDIYRYETGRRRPRSGELLQRIQDVTGIDPGALVAFGLVDHSGGVSA